MLGARARRKAAWLAHLPRSFGEGHVTGVTSWLFYVTGAIVTAMVASSFGGYARAVLAHDNATWARVFAVALVVAMTALNVVGSTAHAAAASRDVPRPGRRDRGLRGRLARGARDPDGRSGRRRRPTPLAGAAKPTPGLLVYVLMLVVLVTALLSTVVTFVVFCTTTLVDAPASSLALVVILALALLMDLGWKRRREHDRRGQSAEHRLSA
ncbi:hypothetical protein GCM10009817_12970 [Terrabacter lapilli]|uniref:Uncharacterized protein n=2 Tax=Terrabacter lapilli TaxID=436231 RepID=A0ABN2RT82_9MICO